MQNGLSIVIPVYNSENTLEELIERIYSTYNGICLFEIILVNDGSLDNSWQIIKKLKDSYANILGVNFDRNYGQHLANLCGFRRASFDYILTIDDDLQNPPEDSLIMFNKAREGFDLVFGKFHNKNHNLVRIIGSKFVNFINKRVFLVNRRITISNFRVIHRSVIEKFIHLNHPYPYLPGLILLNSNNPVNVPVNHYQRKFGKSNYTILKLIKLSFSLLFQHSKIPLRFSSIIGFLVSLSTFGFCILIIFRNILYGTNVPGWTSMILALSFYSGILIMILSIIGEYILNILIKVTPQNSYNIKNEI